MADRQHELRRLVDSIGKPVSAHGRSIKAKARSKAKPQVAFLIAAIVVIVGGLLASFLLSDDSSGPQKLVVDSREPPPAATYRSLAPLSLPAGAGPQAQVVAGEVRANAGNALRPGDFMLRLAASGPLPTFIPPTEIVVGDKPLTVYVLLYARLDGYTENIWKRAGLLEKNCRTESPFLLTVKLSNPEAATYLTDWHVESVALQMPPRTIPSAQ